MVWQNVKCALVEFGVLHPRDCDAEVTFCSQRLNTFLRIKP